ncbi:uncharacterized protein LOC134218682 [Armigeres subalbatus]|uniref:uncharacterized protein LOC134218682 n=1 Tax=Armigeres subalbatus TaxID=124917 RepID=UPI002ED1EAA8
MDSSTATDSEGRMLFKCGENPARHGGVYQNCLALVLFTRSSQNENTKFRIGLEVESSGKFDDINYIRLNPDETWMFQIKHHLSSKVVSFRELFQSKNKEDYDLSKYILSCLETVQDNEGKNRYFLFTNSSLDEKELENWVKIEQRSVSDIMDFTKYGGKYLGFVVNEEKMAGLVSELNAKLKDLADGLVGLFDPSCTTIPKVFESFKAPLDIILQQTGRRRRTTKARCTYLMQAATVSVHTDTFCPVD